MSTFKRNYCAGFIVLFSMLSLYVNAAVVNDGSVDADELFLYTVKKDDTVWGICKTYVTDPLCWKKLVVFNQLKNPKYIPPKSIIRIPKSWLIDQTATALVIALEGDVLVFRQNSKSEDALHVGDLLNQEDVVKSQGGSAMIEFADNSRLLLKENSTIRMANLQFYDATQLVSTRVELLKGRVKAQVEKLSNKDSRNEISTPAAVAAVRGTDFRVERKASASGDAVEMRTELLTGALTVKSDNNQQSITSGQGVLAVEGKGVSEPVRLLPRPLVTINESTSGTLPLLLEWKKIEKAAFYKVTLMTKNAQVWEKTIQAPKFLIEDVEFGQYQLLIRGIDDQGFEGRNRRINLDLSAPAI